jgi:hypothetical protein
MEGEIELLLSAHPKKDEVADWRESRRDFIAGARL